jgi:hypothetical protein
MKKTTLILLGLSILLVGISHSNSGAKTADTPTLSLGMGGGFFEPTNKELERQIENGMGKLSLNYLFTQWLEIGIGSTIQANLVTADLTLRARLNFIEDQVLVPFGGGGADAYWFFGDDKIEGEEINRQGGYHWEGGLLILLDFFDPKQAKEIQKKWGVDNSYISLGYRRSDIDNFGKAKVDIGGELFFGEILLEF